MLRYLLRNSDYSTFISKLEMVDSLVINFLFQHRVCKLDKEIDQKLSQALDFLYEAKLLAESRLNNEVKDEKN